MAAKKTVGELVYKIIGDAKGLGVTLAKSEASVKSFDKSVGKFSKKSIASFVGIGVGVTALGATLVSATKKAAEFESTIGNLSTLVDGNTDSVGEMRDGILALTRTIPRSGEELGSAAYDVLSSGITDTSDALAVLEASGKLAVAGLGDTKQAVNLTTSAINAFKIPAQDADRVAGVLFETVRAGKTTVAELAQSFGNVAAAAQGAGVSLEETQAATAALTTVGFRTATAQDRLRALFDEMTRTTGKLSDKYTELTGKTIATSVQSDGFKNVLDELFGALGNNEIAFKNTISSQEAAGAALSLVSGASDTYNNTLVSMEANSKALDSAFNTQADTTANKLALSQNYMNELLIELGEKILPVVNKALSTFLGYIDAFADYDTITRSYNKTLGELDKKMEEVNAEQGKLISGTAEFSSEEILAAKSALKLKKTIAEQQHVVDLLNESQLLGNDRTEVAAELKEKYNDVLAQGNEYNKKGNVISTDRNKVLDIEREKLAKLNIEYVKHNNDALDPFISRVEDAREANRVLAESMETDEDAIKKARTELESFQTEMLGFIDNSRKVVDTLENELTQGFQKFGEDISGTFQDTNKELASIVVGAEQQLIDLKTQLREADDRDERKRVKKLIEEQKEILDASVGFEERRQERLADIREKLGTAGVGESEIDNLLNVQTLEEEIQEQRRIAALDEFTRFEEEQTKKLTAIVDAFLLERGIIENKIETQKELEADLTAFVLEQNTFRTDSVDDFAENAIEKYKDVAAELRSAVSLQRTLNALRANPEQFQKGGHVGAGGGEVHAGEYVIPANLVSQFGGVISALEGERTGGGASSTKNVNAPITINAPNSDGADFAGIGRAWAWELGRL